VVKAADKIEVAMKAALAAKAALEFTEQTALVDFSAKILMANLIDKVSSLKKTVDRIMKNEGGE
jgi:hypothetical protein